MLQALLIANSTLKNRVLIVVFLNPAHRPTATEVLTHVYSKEDLRSKSILMFLTFPSKAGMKKRRRGWSPSALIRVKALRLEGRDLGGNLRGTRERRLKGGLDSGWYREGSLNVVIDDKGSLRQESDREIIGGEIWGSSFHSE